MRGRRKSIGNTLAGNLWRIGMSIWQWFLGLFARNSRKKATAEERYSPESDRRYQLDQAARNAANAAKAGLGPGGGL